MAAPTTVQTGLAYLLKTDGTTIGGGTNATLTQSQELIETTNKGSSQWKSSLSGVRSWSVDFENMYVESSAEVAGSTLGFTIGGTAVKGIQNIQLQVQTELLPSVNSTTGLDRTLVPSTRVLTCTVSGQWYDIDKDGTPTGGDEALEDVIDAIDGTSTSTVAAVLTFGGSQSYGFTARPSSFSPGTPFNGVMPYTFTIEATGSVSAPTTTNADSGLAAIVADVFASTAASSTVLLSNATDYLEWTGTGYCETLTIDIPYEGVITASGTLQGSGALTKDATS